MAQSAFPGPTRWQPQLVRRHRLLPPACSARPQKNGLWNLLLQTGGQFELAMFHDLKLEVQIDAEKVRNKTEDITRGTVQKSVCVLSRLPLYGQIQVVFFPQLQN